MNIFSFTKNLGHLCVSREHRRHSQFYLTIVKSAKLEARLRHKTLPNSPPEFAFNRQILQVWILRGKPPSCSSGLDKLGVKPSIGTCHLWNHIYVSGK